MKFKIIKNKFKFFKSDWVKNKTLLNNARVKLLDCLIYSLHKVSLEV